MPCNLWKEEKRCGEERRRIEGGWERGGGWRGWRGRGRGRRREDRRGVEGKGEKGRGVGVEKGGMHFTIPKGGRGYLCHFDPYSANFCEMLCLGIRL